MRYHITKTGKPAICNAQPGNCPLGDDNGHFDTEKEAQDYIDKTNSNKYGILPVDTKEELRNLRGKLEEMKYNRRMINEWARMAKVKLEDDEDNEELIANFNEKEKKRLDNEAEITRVSKEYDDLYNSEIQDEDRVKTRTKLRLIISAIEGNSFTADLTDDLIKKVDKGITRKELVKEVRFLMETLEGDNYAWEQMDDLIRGL